MCCEFCLTPSLIQILTSFKIQVQCRFLLRPNNRSLHHLTPALGVWGIVSGFFFYALFFCPNWFEGIDCSQLYMLIRSLDILLLCNWNMTPPFLWMRKPCPSEGTFSPRGMTYLFGIQIVLVWQHWRRALGLILTDLGPGGTEVRQGEDVTWGPGQTPLSWLPCRWWLGPLEHESPGTHNDNLLQRLYLNSPDAPTPDRVPSLD